MAFDLHCPADILIAKIREIMWMGKGEKGPVRRLGKDGSVHIHKFSFLHNKDLQWNDTRNS